MSTHPSNLLIFKDLKPEDIIQGEELEFFRRLVLHQVGRTIAYGIAGYADWLCYTCIRYIEGGGIPDLSHIEKAVIWPDDLDYKTKKIVIDNIYFIIQDLVTEAPHYKNIPEPNFDVGAAVDFMVKHSKDANWDTVEQSLKVMEEGSYTKKLVDLMKRKMKESEND